MIQAYKNFWKQAFNYKGVSTRKEYWLVALVNALIGLVLGILNHFFGNYFLYF
ncbi:TPA: hypothetical protein ACOBTX_002540 [Enterococcus faecium]